MRFLFIQRAGVDVVVHAVVPVIVSVSCHCSNKMKKGTGGVTFQFQGLAGLLVDTSRMEARRIRAFVRIFDDKNELLAVSTSSAPLQRSPAEDDNAMTSNSRHLIRHVAVWPHNSISVHATSSMLRLQIVVKFPSGSTLPVGQCDWNPSSSSSNVDLQVRAFRIEEAGVRIDTQGDSALRARVNRTHHHDQPIADSLGSLDYSVSQSETMLDTSDFVAGSSVSIESSTLDQEKKRARKMKNREINDRFRNLSPAMAMDPLAIRRLFRAREATIVQDDDESEESDESPDSKSVDKKKKKKKEHLEFHPPRSAALTVPKDHLEHLALNKPKVLLLTPSSESTSHPGDDGDDDAFPVQRASPIPQLPPVESIEFEKKEAAVPVITPSPEKPVVKPLKKSPKRLFGSKNKDKRKKMAKRSLLSVEDREEPKSRSESSCTPMRFSKIKSFFKRQWAPEKIYYEESTAQKPYKEREQRVDTPTAEMSYALLSASNCEVSPEDNVSADLTRSIGEARHDTLLQVRDQNVTPVDDFNSEALMENYFSGKPCVDSQVHITPETVTTVATTPERAVQTLLHQPCLVDEAPGAPNMGSSNGNTMEIRSLPCNNSMPTQIGGDENLSAISEKSSPTSSSSNNHWSSRGADTMKTVEDASKRENRRTLDASTSFDADIHGSPLPNELAEERINRDSADISTPVHTEKLDWETFDGNFVAEPIWVASTFNSADSAFNEISPRWRQTCDQEGMWESLRMPKVEDTLNGHVHGEKIQIKLKESSQDTSHSYELPPVTDDLVLCAVEESDIERLDVQRSLGVGKSVLCSHHVNEPTKGKTPDDDDHWIVFDSETKEANICDLSNEEEVLLFEDRDAHVHGIGSLVDWNVGEVYDQTDAFVDACQDLDTVSDKGSDDVIVTTTQMNLDYSILSEEILMDLLPSKNATPERTVDASPARMAYLLSKSPKTPFPLSTLPSLSIETEKEIIKTNVWQKRRTKKKTFVRRVREGIFGMLVCGSHVKILSTDEGADDDDDDSLSYTDSHPIWPQPSKRVDTKPTDKRKLKKSHASKRRSLQQKPIKRKKESAPSTYLGKHRDYQMHKTFSDGGGSPPCRDKVLSPALSDAEDLAWAKAIAARHWI